MWMGGTGVGKMWITQWLYPSGYTRMASVKEIGCGRQIQALEHPIGIMMIQGMIDH